VGKLRGRFVEHGRAVLPDRRVQLHDLPVGVPVGQNQTHDDTSPAQTEAVLDHAATKLAARVAD